MSTLFDLVDISGSFSQMPAPIPIRPVFLNGSANDLPLPDNSIDVIATSPPYNLGDDNMPMGGRGRTSRANGIGYTDNLDEQVYQHWQIQCLNEWHRVAKSGASLFYNHKDRLKDGKMISPLQWLTLSDWKVRQAIVWDRGSTHNHCKVYCDPTFEYVYWLTKGKPITADNIKYKAVWHIPISKPSWHPAPFPAELVRRCLNMVARDGMVVLDPFSGSGTTAKTACVMGYKGIGVEIDSSYIKKSVEVFA